MTLSAADDIAVLRLDFISECLAIAATHLQLAAACASVAEQVGLEYSLRCAVPSLKAALQTYRELKASQPKSPADREAA
jgi:hypothetical protein